MSVIAVGTVEKRPVTKSKWINRMFGLLPPIEETDEEWMNVSPIPIQKEHYRLAMVSVGMVIATSVLLYWLVPGFGTSIIGMIAKVVETISGSETAAYWVHIVLLEVMLFLTLFPLIKQGFALEKAAMNEEKLFRAGAENWNWAQRLMSNLIFGAIHFLNLFVPLSLVIGLATGGWWFMSQYRAAFRANGSRTQALQHSAAVHSAHNRLALGLMPFMLLGFLVYAIVM